jgi:hypothetical protein
MDFEDSIKKLAISLSSILSLEILEKVNNIITQFSPIATAASQTIIFALTCWYLIKGRKRKGGS